MSDHAQIAEHFLPREMRQDLCMGLLEEAGADKVNLREDRGEIIHCCLMPWHNEARPSASINFDSLTYRCLGCGAKGGLQWFIATIRGLDFDQVRDWLAGETGLGGREFQLGPLLQFLDALEEHQKTPAAKPSMPRYAERVLDPWLEHVYPGLTTGVPDLGITGRGIPEENLRAAKVGWDMDANRVVIPNFWKGELVGWQTRRIVDDGSEKYKSTPDFPRDATILGLPDSGLSAASRLLVVESPMSYLRHLHHLPVASTWGASITDRQIQLLKWFPEVTFWVDNDAAGWKVLEGWVDGKGQHHPGAAQLLTGYTNVTVVESDWHADPAQFDDAEAAEMYAARVPLSIWTKPTGALRCRVCTEKHGGDCG